MSLLIRVLFSLLLSGVISGIAFWRGWLTRSGVVGALIVGTLIMGFGGWVWGILLGVFFVSSSMLSKFKEDEKREAAEKFEKGHERDIWQALANAGIASVIAVLSVLKPMDFWFPLFLGVMGTVTADTWATELGTLSKRPPRLITTGKLVEVGTSGGISPFGTLVSWVGGALIGLVGWGLGVGGWGLLLVGGFGGLAGSLIDSLLGATVQQIYYCDTCQKDTEREVHKCGTVTRPLRGWSWLTNDWVNAISSVGGGAVAVLVWWTLGG